MSEPTDTEKIEFLRGQVRALASFATAIIAIYPDPLLLHQTLSTTAEIVLANTEASLVSDRVVAGIQSINDHLLSVSTTRLANQAPPNTTA
jgi:hypothetical protein